VSFVVQTSPRGFRVAEVRCHADPSGDALLIVCVP